MTPDTGMTPEQQAGLDRLNALLQELGWAWWQAMPAGGWDSCELYWAQAGQHVLCSADIERGGRRESFPFPPELNPILGELHHAMTHPTQGGWLSMQARLKPDSSVEVRYNYHDRYYFNGLPTVFDPPQHEAPIPSDEMFLAELERCPREVRLWPAWLTVGGAQVPNFDAPAALPPELIWMTQPEHFGWPAMVQEALNCIRGQLSISPRISPVLMGHAGEEARQTALRQLVDFAVQCELKTIERSGPAVLDKLNSAWLSQRSDAASHANTDAFSNVASGLHALSHALVEQYFQTSIARPAPSA